MPQDSTITVSFIVPGSGDNGREETLVNVVVVKPPEKIYPAGTFILPIAILFVIAFIMFLVLIKVKPSNKLDGFLDRIERMIPKFLRF